MESYELKAFPLMMGSKWRMFCFWSLGCFFSYVAYILEVSAVAHIVIAQKLVTDTQATLSNMVNYCNGMLCSRREETKCMHTESVLFNCLKYSECI